MSALGMTSSQEPRLEALRKKHAFLKFKVQEEQRRPSSGAEFYIRQLKKEKLQLKEEIEGLRRISANA